MPTREEVLEQFRRWKEISARVQVSLEGPNDSTTNRRLLTAQVDGTVELIEAEAESTRVVVARDNNRIHMYLTEACLFQTMTVGASEPATIADMESMIRIGFTTGDVRFCPR